MRQCGLGVVRGGLCRDRFDQPEQAPAVIFAEQQREKRLCGVGGAPSAFGVDVLGELGDVAPAADRPSGRRVRGGRRGERLSRRYGRRRSHVVDAPGLDPEHYAIFDCAMGQRSIEPMGTCA